MSVAFRGFLTCQCVLDVIPYVEDDMLAQGLIKNSLDFYQMGYHPGYGPSGGTHDAGGCFDTGQYSDAQLRVWRKWGCTVQHRTTAQGFSMAHGHGWPRGCPHLSPSARYQASEWEQRRNGLRGRGPVQGPWPILGYQAAIERNPMPLTDKDVDRIAQRTADVLLGRDVIPNDWDDAPTNPTISPKTALRRIGAAVHKLTAPTPPTTTGGPTP